MNWKELYHRVAELAVLLVILLIASGFGFQFKPVLTAFGLLFAILIIVLYVNHTWESRIHERKRGFPEPRPDGYPPLELSVEVVPRQAGENQLNFLLFQFRGGLTAEQMAYQAQFEIRLTDITKGKYRPLISASDRCQERNSSVFELRCPIGRPIPPGTIITTWTPIGQVPVDVLGFPFRGKRKILVELILRNLLDNRIVALAQSHLKLISDEPGFIEAAKFERLAQVETVKLALWLSAIDGKVDDQEVAEIQSWGKRVSNALDAAKSPARLETLNVALREATGMIREGHSGELESQAIAGLAGETPLRLRYDAYELCAQIARADGVADPEEIALLKRIADGLNLDEERTKLLSDRHLADAELGGIGGGEPDSDKLLGINEDMGSEEIRKLLNKQFRKWQGRQGSNDSAVRDKAQEWLDMIAEARNRHLS